MASSLHPTQDDAKASSTDNARYRQLTLGTSQGSSSIGEKKQKLKEIKGDLFSCDPTSSLAHCVSADMHMGKGIAVLFKKKFGGVPELKKQGVRPGGVAVLQPSGGRFVYYLVTKERYFHKPTMDTLEKSLEALCSHARANDVKKLAIPRLGCGLDKLNWDKVSELIEDIFSQSDIEITVYYL